MEKRELKKAIAIMRQGGVVAFPTETSYGLGANAADERAVKKILAIKGRKAEHTPPLIVADYQMALRVAALPPVLRELAREYWPGALTVVAPAKAEAGLAAAVVASDGTIALRVSGHETARALAAGLGGPIVATSANLNGQPASYSKNEYDQQLAGRQLREDYFLDAGTLPKRAASTIIKEENGQILVLRPGSVKLPKKYVA